MASDTSRWANLTRNVCGSSPRLLLTFRTIKYLLHIRNKSPPQRDPLACVRHQTQECQTKKQLEVLYLYRAFSARQTFIDLNLGRANIIGKKNVRSIVQKIHAQHTLNIDYNVCEHSATVNNVSALIHHAFRHIITILHTYKTNKIFNICTIIQAQQAL